ncbi:S8 family serine peptidase [Flagellatimonas centrodinii]|uniref:S8 family serine peptidase n=1 Tax=Flagellatimonas centrodinii TaxID=2806210 RepID=UPI001FEDC0CA|nr:S8 family serine peptidase [Flagellatimonas centrodinii]ULQ47273.1 S8 family serine peptidase [Flagellatimonas centrodinii]
MMKVTWALAMAAASVLPAAWAVTPQHPLAPHVPGEVIVQYRPGAVLGKSSAAWGLEKRATLAEGAAALFAVPAITDVASMIDALADDPAVAWAEPNYLRYPLQTATPNDPLFGDLWGLQNTGQANFVPGPGAPVSVVGADMNLLAAWDPAGDGSFTRTGDPSVVVAIIDDGFEIGHADLADNFISAAGYGDPRPTSSEQNHGTLVAGSLGAIGNNGRGVAGTTWRSSLLPLRVGSSSGGLSSADIMRAIEYARDNGADIINASFGGPGYSQTEENLIRGLADRDILFVAAAGNDDANLDFGRLAYPALYDARNVIAVAATNRQDDIASFSMYGPLSADVAAPGLQIVTTAVGGGYVTGNGCGSGGNCGVSGTSFSAPYVAGIAALLKAHVSPTPGWREIKARLVESGDSLGNARARSAGGRVDAAAALDMSPRPSLTIDTVTLDDGNNGRLDPGETLDVVVTVFNGWMPASNVQASLSAQGPVTVNDGTLSLGSIAADGTAQARFSVTVGGTPGQYEEVIFTLALSADGGYSTQRSFIQEVALLPLGMTVNPSFQIGLPDPDALYDEFHTWHLDVPSKPAGTHTLVVRSRTANEIDIDLLGRAGSAPRYLITLNLDPNIPTNRGFFCTGTTAGCQDPNTLVGGRFDGNEANTFVLTDGTSLPQSFYFTVVNFAQAAFGYELSASLEAGDLRPAPFNFEPATQVPPGQLAVSNVITVSGITAPTFAYAGNGQISVNNGPYVTDTTVENGDTVRARALSPASGTTRADVTIGGEESSFIVTPGAVVPGPGVPGPLPSGGGGALSWWMLCAALIGVASRRVTVVIGRPRSA